MLLINRSDHWRGFDHIFLTHDRFHCHVTKQYGAPPNQYLYLEQMIIDYIESEWHGE